MKSKGILQKAILYKAKHRGSKELDLILGGFVDQVIDTLSDKEFSQLLRLLEEDDMQIIQLLDETPTENNEVITRLQQYWQSLKDL